MGSDSPGNEMEYECGNCLSATTQFGDCPVCGTAPHKGEGYKIHCKECGSVEYAGRGSNIQFDMTHHRDQHCPGAEFEVTAL